MSDPAFDLLRPYLQHASAPSLWLADENLLSSAVAPNPAVRVIGNRIDQIESLRRQGWQANWSDFDFSAIPDRSISRICYRVSKEKALVHHNINASLRVLSVGGELILTGDKGEGIKGYLDRAKKLFAGQCQMEKVSANCWRGLLIRPEVPGPDLDDRDYTRLRPVCRDTKFVYWSKPGIFGWDKIDKGSAFLAEHLEAVIGRLGQPPERILDLGCGYGYLSLQAARLGVPIIATDNNAAAIAACRRNFAEYGLAGEVIPASCAAGIQGTFPLILCNPPFHAGFGVTGDLTDRFLTATARHLAPYGVAAYVVNRHIMLERKASRHFRQIDTLASNGSFKLVLLAGPLSGT